MPRVHKFIHDEYWYKQNPYPSDAVAQPGSRDRRESGELFNKDVDPAKYEEAVDKFVVRPLDSGSKMHLLWSLGERDGARGFGKTALLRYLEHEINCDLGRSLLTSHGFEQPEVVDTPIIAAYGSFDTNSGKTLSAVCLQQAIGLLDEHLGKSVLERVRAEALLRLSDAGDDADTQADDLEMLVEDTYLSIRGKTLGYPIRQIVHMFAEADWRSLKAYLRSAKASDGFNVLNTMFVIARSAGVKRIYLLTDQVEDFANANTARKLRHVEIERLRDLAIESQPFGEMSSYVFTMHPEAARQIEPYWSEARLQPELDPMVKRARGTAVIMRPVTSRAQAQQLYLNYSNAARIPGGDINVLHPLDETALDVLIELGEGRAGEMLKHAHRLIEEGAQDGLSLITESEARDILDDIRPADEKKPVRRARGIGLVH